MSEGNFLNKIMTKTTCETYVPLSIGFLAGVTGAVEGFIVGGVLGAIPSAGFQAIGGHRIGELICDSMAAEAVEKPMPTPDPAPGTTFLARR